jgi:hypothetical protein
MKMNEYINELKNCISREEVERFLAEYKPNRNPNSKLKGKNINQREFLTYILDNIDKLCAREIKRKRSKEWNNPGNLAAKFFEELFGDEFKNEVKSEFDIPKLDFSNIDVDSSSSWKLFEVVKPVENWVENLENVYDKNLWESLLKEDYFTVYFTHILNNAENYEKLKSFLKENFQNKIDEKIKAEIDKALAFMSDSNELYKTFIPYVIDWVFEDFYNQKNYPSSEDVFKKFDLKRFYENKIFERLINSNLENINLFILALMTNWNFNAEFYVGNKRTRGDIFDLTLFYDETEAVKFFADTVLLKMVNNLNEFYFVLEDGEYWQFSYYLKNSEKLKELFEDDGFREEAIRTYYDWKSQIPWSIVNSCDELKEIFDEDVLEEIAQNEGCDSFEEICEEYIG